jgi:hypothetical protein
MFELAYSLTQKDMISFRIVLASPIEHFDRALLGALNTI